MTINTQNLTTRRLPFAANTCHKSEFCVCSSALVPTRVDWIFQHRGLAMLFIIDPTRGDVCAEGFASAYHLTGAERAVAMEIANGRGIEGAADNLGTSAATARTHLSRIVAKTGTRRQAQLVRLLLQSQGGPGDRGR